MIIQVLHCPYCPQRLAPAPYLWRAVRDTPTDALAHPTAARGEDDAPHRRRGISRGLCSGGAGAKMAFENPIRQAFLTRSEAV
jgi:hypothetical protein